MYTYNVHYADFKEDQVQEMGPVDVTGAIEAFRTFPWDEEHNKAQQLYDATAAISFQSQSDMATLAVWEGEDLHVYDIDMKDNGKNVRVETCDEEFVIEAIRSFFAGADGRVDLLQRLASRASASAKYNRSCMLGCGAIFPFLVLPWILLLKLPMWAMLGVMALWAFCTVWVGRAVLMKNPSLSKQETAASPARVECEPDSESGNPSLTEEGPDSPRPPRILKVGAVSEVVPGVHSEREVVIETTPFDDEECIPRTLVRPGERLLVLRPLVQCGMVMVALIIGGVFGGGSWSRGSNMGRPGPY